MKKLFLTLALAVSTPAVVFASDLDAALAALTTGNSSSRVTNIYDGTVTTGTVRRTSDTREVISVRSSTGSTVSGVRKTDPLTGRVTTSLSTFQAR